jgi:hypothetical protein
MKKGAINYIAELFIGAFILFFIIMAGFIFGEMSNAKAEAELFAINTGAECYNNINNVMKMDNIFNGKQTSSVFAKTTDLQSDLDTLQQWIASTLPDKIALKAYTECKSIVDGCDKDPIATSSNEESGDEDILNAETCLFIVPQKCTGDDYFCNLYIEMEVSS